ncbi:hypothetical protein LLH23_05455 [bacterium]|nr:hypothetical protein [bacterium]
MRTRFAILPAVLLSCLTLAQAAARLPGSYYNDFQFGYETPHTKWARPLAGGKVRAFFIAPTHTAREVAELAQRLDLEPGGETALDGRNLGNPGSYGPYPAMVEGTSSEEKELAVLSKLAKPYDVYVIANFPLAKLPIRVQYEILRRVKEGAGLVLVYKREADERLWRHQLPDAALQAADVPLAGLTFYRGKMEKLSQGLNDLVDGYRVGEGRVVRIDYGMQSPAGFAGGWCLTPQEPYTYRTLTEYDYHQSLVAKAVLWAAKREPKVRFVGLPFAGFQLDDPAAPLQLKCSLANLAGKAVPGQLWVRVRNEWGEVEQEATTPRALAVGDNPLALSLPRLPGGTHFLDLKFSSKDGVLGWASAAVFVKPVQRVAEVKPAQVSFAPGEPCTGQVSLLPAAPDASWALRVTLLDNYGRVFARKQFPLQAGQDEVAFSVPLGASVSLAGRARVMLLRQGVPWDQKEQEFFVRQGGQDDFPALVWGNLPGIFGHFTGVRLHEAGFSSILHYYGRGEGLEGEGRLPEAIARDDFHAVPYVTRISWDKGRLGAIEQDEKARQDLVDRATASKPYAPLVYSLGDENFIPPEGGFDESERPRFAAFLKQRYGGDLKALNAAWGTTFTDFAEVAPMKAGDAARQANWVPFHDTECFREFLYANWHHWAREVIRQVDPQGAVGAEGSVPGDMELSIQGLEFWGPYRRVDQNTLLRSLAPRELVRGNWFGGYNSGRRDLPGLPRFLWESLLDGSNLLEVYCSYTCENFYNTDLTWAYWMDSFLPDLKEITEGLGQLLARSEHDCDAVAVLHSQPSVHFEQLSQPFGDYTRAMTGALRLLEDLSFVPYNLTSRQLEAGLLNQRRPAVLLLPHAVCLSDKEVAELERYVREGGVLIADVRPGIAMGNCALRGKGALDGLFGVTREAGPGRAVTSAATLSGSAGRYHIPDGSTMPAASLDASVKLADGTALGKAGDTPLFVVKTLGRGTAVLLNCSFGDYDLQAAQPGEMAAREVMRMFAGLSAGQPHWQVEVTATDGRPLSGKRVSAFVRGKARLVGLLPPRPEDVKATVPMRVRLAAPAHLYDLRAGKYVGKTDATTVNGLYTSATFLTALPYKVQKLTVTAPTKAVAGTPCAVQVKLAAEGDLQGARPVFRVNVLGPDGRDRLYYARTLCPSGLQAAASIPFASNDAPGVWKIVARDVLTGTTATATVKLEASQ